MPAERRSLVVDGSEPIQNLSDMYASRGPRPYDPNVISYEDTAGTGPAEQRLQEQDVENIEAEVLFPAKVAGPASWRRIKDDDAYLATVRAYNDWLAEEYCATIPDRLIGLAVLPWTTCEDMIAGMERCARKGFKGVSLGGLPRRGRLSNTGRRPLLACGPGPADAGGDPGRAEAHRRTGEAAHVPLSEGAGAAQESARPPVAGGR